uniref:Mannan endo-1,4-beta-mannosidase n=2 Tax=Paramoeba aestuarina TaxID=180227 RepID=A0A7S4NS90_9EUKA
MDVIRAIVNVEGCPPMRYGTYASPHYPNDTCVDTIDVISMNGYPGWYPPHNGQSPIPELYWHNLTQWAATTYPNKPITMSETGGGAVYEWDNKTAPLTRWSQQWQAFLVMNDAAFGKASDLVSGLSLWQFCDTKADDSDTKSCGSCVYNQSTSPGYPTNMTLPWNCAYIDVTCQRPGGENHKGIVDAWRRTKRAFDVVSKLFE